MFMMKNFTHERKNFGFNDLEIYYEVLKKLLGTQRGKMGNYGQFVE
jgi:mRNA-degrading endonuclease RelE of RelBE toxin-antitoxin system